MRIFDVYKTFCVRIDNGSSLISFLNNFVIAMIFTEDPVAIRRLYKKKISQLIRKNDFYKADILKNTTVKSALAGRGITGAIVSSQTLARADGRSARTSLNLSTAGLVPGQRAAILYYLPGDITPRLAYPTWRNGKLRVTLPLPCMYNLVF